MKIVWSPLALERVEDTARYIAEDNPDAAVRWVEDLFSAVERLGKLRISPTQGSETSLSLPQRQKFSTFHPF